MIAHTMGSFGPPILPLALPIMRPSMARLRAHQTCRTQCIEEQLATGRRDNVFWKRMSGVGKSKETSLSALTTAPVMVGPGGSAVVDGGGSKGELRRQKRLREERASGPPPVMGPPPAIEPCHPSSSLQGIVKLNYFLVPCHTEATRCLRIPLTVSFTCFTPYHSP